MPSSVFYCVFVSIILSSTSSSLANASCYEPPVPSNGYITLQSIRIPGTDFQTRDFISYGCNSGYMVIGVPTIECHEDGTWSAMPQCRPGGTAPGESCPPPPVSPKHLKVKRTKAAVGSGQYPVGTEISYSCNKPAETPVAVTTCMKPTPVSPPVWYPPPQIQASACSNQVAPSCQSCVNPPSVNNAQMANAGKFSYAIGETVQYRCNSGYKASGDAVLRCKSDCTWEVCFQCNYVPPPPPPPPVCCTNPPYINNAQSISQAKSSYQPSECVQYKCMQGYQASGNTIAQCNNKGKWDVQFQCNPLPTPPPVCCTNPPQVSCAQMTSPWMPSYKKGEAIQYKCIEGYKASGNTTLKCKDDCKWDNICFQCNPAPPPTCCTNPPHVNNAQRISVTKPSYNKGESVQYRCMQGYQPSNSNTNLQCTNDCKWSDICFECKPIPTTTPPPKQQCCVPPQPLNQCCQCCNGCCGNSGYGY